MIFRHWSYEPTSAIDISQISLEIIYLTLFFDSTFLAMPAHPLHQQL